MPEQAVVDRLARLTERQRQAVRTVDRSVLVSAAAGSGKTTVLAERCAGLVCDLPPQERCGIDELLVVTFTEAAASEMRVRIAAAIRERLAARPGDQHLQEQLYLVDSAAISTIHAFCRSLIERWFPQAGIDPQFTVLDEDEALLTRQEALTGLFAELYAAADGLGPAFRQLIDDYGAGEDAFLPPVILRIHAFTCSLADPQAWLDGALRRFDPDAPDGLSAHLDNIQSARLADGLEEYIDRAEAVARTIRDTWPVAEPCAADLDAVVRHLRAQLTQLYAGAPWEQVAAAVANCAPPFSARQPPKLPQAEKDRYQQGKKLRDDYRDDLKSNLQEAFRTTRAELLEGLQRVRPYVQTLISLVRAFDARYAAAKQARAVLDFNDLQRVALNLLCESGDTHRPGEVARRLQARFRHVLVDEFQDIDPLQEAILRLVSREEADPPQGNLFAVGDIKQSIYRFRLAEPALFAERADRFAEPDAPGTLIHLQENHRSRPELIEAVNLFFAPLMSHAFGGSDYDEYTRLYAGAIYPPPGEQPTFGRPAVEVHLVEVDPSGAPGGAVAVEEDNGEDQDDQDEFLQLEGVEYEACLIAERIQAWVRPPGGGTPMMICQKPARPGDPPGLRPIRYGDIVILLRSMPHKAAPMAAVLRARGVPVVLDRADDTLDSTEFRDVHSLLRVLDNFRQDIPLAALLRSPLTGDPLSDEDLLRIRLGDRRAAFHEAVLAYRSMGDDVDLRSRLDRVLARLEHYRERIRHEPVADVLWQVFQESRYLAFVSGLPDGPRRRDRLIRVHELARKFSRFSRQGLRRFLAFLDQVADAERPARPPASAGEDAVRIMTIHSSKGLEFPVVILADLSKSFNLSDIRADVLVDRQTGVGIRAADPDRRLRYPTFSHHIVAGEVRAGVLAEELRVLYVALTRAREHLVLVGRTRPSGSEPLLRPSVPSPGKAARVPRHQLLSARNCLDWVRAALAAAPAGAVRWPHEPPGDAEHSPKPTIQVHYHPWVETCHWSVPAMGNDQMAAVRSRLARLEALPDGEPFGPQPAAQAVLARCSWEYPHLELAALPARVSAGELKRRWNAAPDPEERPVPVPAERDAWTLPAFLEPPLRRREASVARGLATHRLLEMLDPARPCDRDDLQAQLDALVAGGAMSRREADDVALDDVAWFWQTELGRMIRGGAWRVEREVPFVGRVPPGCIDPAARPVDPGDMLLARGIVDLLLTDGRSAIIVDFKTDRVGKGEVPARSRAYAPQLDLYARTMSAIHRVPVIRRCLVFLHARTVVDLDTG